MAKRRRIGLLVIGAVLAVVLVLGALTAFFVLVVPHDRVPDATEMPAASDVPTPANLELVDGRCSGGNAGCYKGIQQFDLRSRESTTASSLHCEEFVRNLQAKGWSDAEVSDLGSGHGYVNSGGNLAAKCED